MRVVGRSWKRVSLLKGSEKILQRLDQIGISAEDAEAIKNTDLQPLGVLEITRIKGMCVGRGDTGGERSHSDAEAKQAPHPYRLTYDVARPARLLFVSALHVFGVGMLHLNSN